MSREFSDETLMAFADGVLDEPEFGEIAEAVEGDPAIAARLEALAMGGRLAKALYQPLADQPVPTELRRAVDGAIARHEGIGATTRPMRRRMPAVVRFALAACVAALIAGPVGYLAGRTGQELSAAIGVGQPLSGEVADLLGALPSGEDRQVAGQVLRPIASFDNGDATFCREFELDGETTTVAVACREGAAWQVAFALNVPRGDDGYAPAAAIDSLETYMHSIGAGPPYSVDQEAAALGPR